MKRIFLALVAAAFCAASVEAESQGPAPPQAPAMAKSVCPVVGGGRCDNGCKCFEGGKCLCAVAKAAPDALDQMRATAIKQQLPLIIFVSQKTRPVAGCLVVYQATHRKVESRGVVVCRPKGLKLWRQGVIDGKPLTSEILAVLNPPAKAQTVRAVRYQPMRSGFGGGNCGHGG